MRQKLLDVRDWFLILAEQAEEKDRWRYFELAESLRIEAEKIK